QAGLRNSPNLANFVLVCTAEPCPMCTAASVFSGVEAIVFGASIQTLADRGWFQILIRACDVAAPSRPTQRPLVYVGVLSDETDLLYAAPLPGLQAITTQEQRR